MMRKAMIGLAGLLALTGCEKPLTPPTHTGVCWRLAEAMNGRSDFRPLRTEVPTLQACAVLLEGLHVAHKVPITGAYQGQIIYVTDAEITAAASSKAKRYPLFTPQQRAQIDQGLSQMLDAR